MQINIFSDVFTTIVIVKYDYCCLSSQIMHGEFYRTTVLFIHQATYLSNGFEQQHGHLYGAKSLAL